jgi:hypothetical protein
MKRMSLHQTGQPTFLIATSASIYNKDSSASVSTNDIGSARGYIATTSVQASG